jgi:GH15 family glucan-1,4-alpha-glucosidase
LAVCIAGLRAAIKLLGKKRTWLQTEKEMSSAFAEVYSSGTEPLPRTYRAGRIAKHGKTTRGDSLPDASLLGLVYPSGVLDPLDERMETTVHEIIKANTTGDGGLSRYPGDLYCGGVRNGRVSLTGGGAWPLLSFWMAIYYCLAGDRATADKHFNWPLERVQKYIPEQILKDKSKAPICPLLWSHAIFVIAARFLGHL